MLVEIVEDEQNLHFPSPGVGRGPMIPSSPVFFQVADPLAEMFSLVVNIMLGRSRARSARYRHMTTIDLHHEGSPGSNSLDAPSSPIEYDLVPRRCPGKLFHTAFACP